ncbi:uncharacterized protein LOC111706663 [Eurytemora carolleeae]|uniref:uncharacterized protein LOC111706663 n=1 Tax=Eurytemora carolleeae TaxID=1294199 RepID=UPI000C78793F|nr:uncharacterized protein LOC111706663 [Eurytemora carolleeae]|eukprot:XP_023335344.1 uncharacterized protein LOC111706663 [Eurytemora affinis]
MFQRENALRLLIEYTSIKHQMAKRRSLKHQLLSMEINFQNGNPEDPPRDGDTTIECLHEDCLGLILNMLDPATVAVFERTSKHIYSMIETHQYWRRLLKRLLAAHPYLKAKVCSTWNVDLNNLDSKDLKYSKSLYKKLARELNQFWKRSDRWEPTVTRNSMFFCQKQKNQKIVSLKVAGDHIVTVLGPRTRSDDAIFTIKVFDRQSEACIHEISSLSDKPEYLVFSSKYNLLVAKAHECHRTLPDTINIWSFFPQPDPLLRRYHLKSSGIGARCTSIVIKEDFYFGSSKKDVVVMAPTRYNNKSVVRFLSLKKVDFSPESYPQGAWKRDLKGDNCVVTNNGQIFQGAGVAIEEVGRVMVPHLVQLGVADFSEKWAILFTEAPKELPDRTIQLIVIEMASMAVKYLIKAYEPRIAVYGASLHQQEPDVAVTVGKDGYLKVFDLHHGRELTTQRVPKPMARTNTAILDFFGTTRFLLGSITDIHVFDLQFPLYPSQEARLDRIERRREHIRTVSIYGDVFQMVEVRVVLLKQ